MASIYRQAFCPDTQIRLLGFTYDPSKETFIAELKPVSREQPPDYCALSYCWRDGSNQDVNIYINDQPFRISVNVYQALEQLLRRRVNVVWIDRICINQKDGAEKSTQVSYMGDIYERAAWVCAWIGPDDYKTKFAMESLGDVSSKSFEEIPAEGFLAIDQLVERAWFERIWVIQEVTRAREAMLLCGPYSLSYSTALQAFCRLLDAWVRSSYPIITCTRSRIAGRTQHFVGAMEAWERTLGGDRIMPLQLALRISRDHHLRVTDERDRVWGLLNILPMEDRLALYPDYGQDYEGYLVGGVTEQELERRVKERERTLHLAKGELGGVYTSARRAYLNDI